MKRDENDWRRFKRMAQRMAEMLEFKQDQEFRRASGECLCLVCGLPYREHPHVEPSLRVICDGDLVHI